MSRLFDALRTNVTTQGPARFSEPVSGLGGVRHVRCKLIEDSHVLTPVAIRHPASERFHMVEHRLKSLRRSRRLSTLLVTSSIPQEGKTLVAINLSIALSAGARSVLLIDGDMRRPSVSRVLGLGQMPGVAECLEGTGTLLEQIVYIEDLGVYYLAAGSATGNVGDLVQRPAARTLLAEASELFEWVIMDSPPLTAVADAHCLAAAVDGALLVARCGVSRNDDLKVSLAALEDTYVAGVVLNGCDDRQHGSYYNYSRTYQQS